MRPTVTQEATRIVSMHLHRHVLKPLGFAKTGLHMVRPTADVFHGIAVSGDRWASADRGAFSLAVHVSIPSLYSYWCGREFPRNPNTAYFPLVATASELVPDRRLVDWSVTRATRFEDLASAAESVVREYALPYLASLGSKSMLYERVRTSPTIPGLAPGHARIVHAMLAHEFGSHAEARAELRAAYEESETPGIAAVVETVAERLGLKLRGSKTGREGAA